MKEKIDVYNCLAIAMLDFLNNSAPTEKQISMVEQLIRVSWIKNKSIFIKDLNIEEKICLELSAYGTTTKQISVILKVSIAQVARYKESILRKTNCKNLVQVIYLSICYGINKLYEDPDIPIEK